MKLYFKNISIILAMSALLFTISCDDDKMEEMEEVDCSNSNLSLAASGITEATCAEGGQVTLEASGGEEPYSYSIDGIDYQTESLFEDLVGGTYVGLVTDDNNCEASFSVTITTEEGTVAFTTSQDTDAGCGTSNGQVTVTASGGSGSLMYSVDGGSFSENNVLTGLAQGEHNISVKDENGCESSSDTFVLSGTSYADEVADIISASCAISGCHDGGNSLPDFTMFANIQSNAAGIKSRTQSGSMPKTGSLTQMEIDLIACWVDDGAPNN